MEGNVRPSVPHVAEGAGNSRPRRPRGARPQWPRSKTHRWEGPGFAHEFSERSIVLVVKVNIPHTHVHRSTTQFLEPAQDILGVGIGLALFGVMIRTIAWLILRIFRPALDFRQRSAEVLFMLAS
jgi:hypothetical protein